MLIIADGAKLFPQLYCYIIKFWDNKKDIFTPVHTGQLLMCFAVLITRYNAQPQLNATDQTTIQIHTTPEQQKVLTVIAYDNKRSDNNVEILTETGSMYKISHDLFQSCAGNLPFTLDTTVMNDHIIHRTVHTEGN